MISDANFCPCDDCSHCVGSNDPEWGYKCDLDSGRFAMTLKEIFDEYFEDYVKEEMKNGLSREDAEKEVREKYEDDCLVYCPEQEDQLTFEEYLDGYYEHEAELAEQKREAL